MGELDEDKLCDGEDAPPSVSVTSFNLHVPGGPRASKWISSPDTSIEYRAGGFAVGYPSQYNLVEHCYHGLPRGLQLYSLILPTETPVPPGAFNPRSDRSFSDSWEDAVSEVEGAKGPQEHLDTGSAELEVTVKAISERKATRKRDKYRDPDPQDGIYGFYG